MKSVLIHHKICEIHLDSFFTNSSYYSKLLCSIFHPICMFEQKMYKDTNNLFPDIVGLL